jgi:hypothetical protein
MCCEQFFAHRKTLFLGKNQKRGHEWAMQPKQDRKGGAKVFNKGKNAPF